MWHRVPGLLQRFGSAAKRNVGTAANQLIALDTAGKLPAVDGSLLTNLPGSIIGIQFLTSASGTYTRTSGATKALVIPLGAGGAGGGCNNNGIGRKGGGGGPGELRAIVTPVNATESYVCGVGGTGVSNGTGNTGGDTTFGTSPYVTAKGGTGGTPASAGSDGNNGSPPAGSGGNALAMAIAAGIASVWSAIGTGSSLGAGGYIPWFGIGGLADANGGSGSVVGHPAQGFGAGGGGAASRSDGVTGTNRAGGNGMPGCILVIELAA